ncbi:MAG TPA: PilW family protein [Burkholderiales bacterium]|nr:PilW family protein [Burkholderiales bacterium]
MRNAIKGFSLVELMVSIALGLMLLAGLATIFSNTTRARGELQRSSQQVDNGRYAIEVLSEDVQLAGYYGELDVSGMMVPGALPDLCSVDPAIWNSAIPLHLQGIAPGGALPACIPGSIVAGSSVVGVRRAQTCIAGVGTCDALVATQPYVQIALCSTSPSAYALGIAADTPFALQMKDCATAAGVRRYVSRIYYISSNNGGGLNVPTLKRLELNGASFDDVPLVEGIERLHVEYGIDTDGDGDPDAYTPDPSSFNFAGCGACSEPQNWSNVVTAKIYVLSRALEPSPGYTNTKVYELGLDAAGAAVRAGPFNDAFRRQVFSTAVRVVNPSGRRETP